MSASSSSLPVNAHPAATNLASSVSLAPLPQAGGDESGVDTPPNPGVFPRERQAAFLAALAVTGSVRSASVSVGVSHQTAYRARLASPGFRRAWDAALLAARAQAEEVLARKALDGWDEEVVYHGEVVCTRRRFSDRLLLAHLARLDRLCGDAEVAEFADSFDDALARYAAGEDRPARVVEPDDSVAPGEGGFSSSGQWSMRSTQREAASPHHHRSDGPAGAERPLRVPRAGEELPPPLPPQYERGARVREAQQLEVGEYEVWLEETGERMLTTWPAPEGFAGEVLAVHQDEGDVIGAWPLDPEAAGAARCFWARTLTPEEEAGLLAADERTEAHRAARLALYQRAAFGLASPAELASLAAANDGDPQWGSPR
jgi:hypothetical protein